MYERKGDGTQPLDFNNDMLVVADPAGVAGIARERAGGNTDMLTYTEILFAINLTLNLLIVCGKQTKKIEFIG